MRKKLVSTLRIKSVYEGDRPRAWKGIEVLLAHLFRVFIFLFSMVWGPTMMGSID